MKKDVVIIGCGVSGLTAGIYSLINGYDTVIYEKNAMPGGECTGWNRRGYHIDNCIHFLVGCNDEDALNKIWKDTGVLGEGVKLYWEPCFYSMEMGGKHLHLWRDIDKTRLELLEAAPEDEKELKLFFECVKGCECIKPPCAMNPAHMNVFQFMKMGMSMMDAGKANKEYGKQTMLEFTARFKNPYIRALFGNYFNSNFIALTFVTSYAFYTSNTVAIPEGGSTGMISRMVRKFESLGGKIIYSSEVKEAVTQNERITFIKLKNDEEVTADNYIWAADPYPLFHQIIGTQYMDSKLKYMYDHPKGYKANTGYQAAFGIISDKDLKLPEGSVIFPCKEYVVANEKHDFCGMKVYDYDDGLFQADRRVIQCNILQDASNYDYWAELYKDKSAYDNEKSRIADELKDRLAEQYPQLKDNLVLLSTYSPVTFNRWCNAHKGGYMSFNALKGFKSIYVKNTVSGINNLFLAGQWLQNSGGLPIAAAEGKFAVSAMIKKNR